MFKKRKKIKKIMGVGWGDGKGWFIRKNYVVGVFVLFLYLFGIRIRGFLNMIVGIAWGISVLCSILIFCFGY